MFVYIAYVSYNKKSNTIVLSDIGELMKKTTLGNTDILVTKICLGTMTWGFQNTQEQAHEQLDYAVDKNVNFIDTAEIYAVPPSEQAYGRTESYIGSWFAKKKNRKDIVLASKIAHGVPWIRNGQGFSSKTIKEALENSLKRLQTDYIDLYQLHWPARVVPKFGKLNFHEDMVKEDEDVEDNILECLETLTEVKKEGKIRAIGLSNETPWGVMKFLSLAKKHNFIEPISIQNAYSLFRREYEVGLAEVSMRENVGLLAYSPLAGGILSGKYQGGKQPEGARYSTWGKERMGYYNNSRTNNYIDKIIEIAKEANMTVTQLALSFVNDRGFVTSNIIGATSLEQLKENISSADISLSKGVRDKLDVLFTEYPNIGTR